MHIDFGESLFEITRVLFPANMARITFLIRFLLLIAMNMNNAVTFHLHVGFVFPILWFLNINRVSLLLLSPQPKVMHLALGKMVSRAKCLVSFIKKKINP